jgi:signal transduction histidine kinase
MSPPSSTDSHRASGRHVARYRSSSRHLPEQLAEESAAAPDPFDRRERFAAYIAHELRTPIALQLALAEAALADPHADALAWRAMSEGIVGIPQGRIEVATRTDAGRALLSVANTGPFIPAGELTRLFQPFERLGSQPQAGAEGNGLGLTIVQSVADAHNATVTAHAPASGGLQIEVMFPRA